MRRPNKQSCLPERNYNTFTNFLIKISAAIGYDGKACGDGFLFFTQSDAFLKLQFLNKIDDI